MWVVPLEFSQGVLKKVEKPAFSLALSKKRTWALVFLWV
jgi:hypothetical protein